ncbi:MAG TPA: class I SAM-dependent methyltransferase [Thermoanaerobaculia bacterium]|jgi:SAM-dependent methyltransferase|nr:class I SAM-dependent methyltransferase [Thermoanaerobaculia bacterium]
MKRADSGDNAYWANLHNYGWDELWMNHPLVRERINRRVTGDPTLWPIQWLPTVVPGRTPFAKTLNVGCGVGHLERSLLEHGIVTHVTGIDASETAVDEARRSTSGLAGAAFMVADARAYLREARGFDAIFFHASLHHFDRLPELLGLVRGALGPRGILYFDEYVGPARDEWTWRHLVQWNAVYRRLPSAVRRTRIIRKPINREDPTEAIASSEILPAVSEHFRILARRDYGGDLLAVIYPSLLRPDQEGGPSSELFAEVVASLLDREEPLLARGRGSFQTVVVAEPL